MTGSSRAHLLAPLLITLVAGFAPRGAAAQAPPPAGGTVPGQFFTIEEPIDSDTLDRLKAQTKQLIARSAREGAEPILVFEIRPGRSAPGTSGFGTSLELANFLSTGLAGARSAVAYVPEPLKGYACLAALACDEIVMGPNASIGPITPEGEPVHNEYREFLRTLARRKVRDPDLLAGMLDRDADLKAVRTADRQIHYVLAENLPTFLKEHQAGPGDVRPAWDGGQRGVMPAKRARDEGLSRLIAEDRAAIANVYRIASKGLADDPTLLSEAKPVWIEIEGRIDSGKESYLRRRVDQARREGVNLVFFQINSPGGLLAPADNIAGLIAGIKDMKTVAFIDDRALGMSAIIALACDEIVLRRGGQIGDVRMVLPGGRSRPVELEPEQITSLGRRFADLAQQKGHPAAVAHAMVDPALALLHATDTKTGAPTWVTSEQARLEPERFVNTSTVKEAGQILTVTSSEAGSLGIGQEVADVEGFKALFGLKGKTIRVDGPTWVDGLVATLNDPFVGWVLLFVGIFMMVLEIKMPGVGLPAITSALAFLLFFWSRYLSGTADQLEILLFLVGMVCLGLELFVFPGFGVFGLSGFVLIVVSIVMASHTFVWPTQEYEYRQMAGTLLQFLGVMVGVGSGIALVGRYIPSIPVFNRMILKPEMADGSGLSDPYAKPSEDSGYESFAFLMGETGRTTTVLRPTGKARFGNLLVEVSANGLYLERDVLVEVIDVQGTRVIVRPMA
ncbi:NfeD family protein [Tundrisphaera sp. TA3]|uniref:NfeD family protein n=1 Tax=Tundrisphaera sp. TA3 TaxID=3435775 RepID=UPI003EB78E72